VSDKNGRRDLPPGATTATVCRAANRGERGDVPVPYVIYALLSLSYALLATRPVAWLTIVSLTT